MEMLSEEVASGSNSVSTRNQEDMKISTKEISGNSHLQKDAIKKCVEAWDRYNEQDGMLCLKYFWAREKFQRRFGITYSTFYRYARIDGKLRRNPLCGWYNLSSSQESVRDTYSTNEDFSMNQLVTKIASSVMSGDITSQGEFDDHCFASCDELYNYIHSDGFTMQQIFAFTSRGMDDPLKARFEMWHFHNEHRRVIHCLYSYGQVSSLIWEQLM